MCAYARERFCVLQSDIRLQHTRLFFCSQADEGRDQAHVTQDGLTPMERMMYQVPILSYSHVHTHTNTYTVGTCAFAPTPPTLFVLHTLAVGK